ncbi:ubiquitin 3 binding protein But2 C-terminal domain-containing protein [Nemania sp. FL0916]|nr:ubiquitin 3 binding protein But2 C-terminal domain-containing protein [Nemania sp. FL0916]
MILVMLIPLIAIFWLQSVDLVVAHATRDNVGCGFHLSCSGSFNGSIGEKTSGQAHASSNVTPSLFTWFGDAFADQQGSGCWWTPPTFTLQCDRNQPPDHGFQIGCDGSLSFNGQTVFYECPTGEGDEVNIYLQPNGGQCHEITIQADNCAPSTCPAGGGGPAPIPGATNSPTSSPQPSTLSTTLASSLSTPSTETATSPSSPPQGGPLTPSPFTTGGGGTSTTSVTSTSTVTTIVPPAASSSTGCVEVGPDSIILTDQGNPNTAYGPNPEGHIQVSPNASTIFNFRFGDADQGKTCRLSFRLPPPPPPPGPSGGIGGGANGAGTYNLTGTGPVTFAALDGWAHMNTTYASTPRVIDTLATVPLLPGGELEFPEFPCPGPGANSSVLLREAPLADTCLDCFEGRGVGLWLRKC